MKLQDATSVTETQSKTAKVLSSRTSKKRAAMTSRSEPRAFVASIQAT